MAPPSFDDLSKSIDDLMGDDFGDKKFVKMKGKTVPVATGAIGLTSETGVKGDKLTGKFSAKWAHKASGFSIDKAALDPKLGIGALEASYKLPNDVSAKCKVEPPKSSGEVSATYSTKSVYAGLLVKAKKSAYDSSVVDASMAYDGLTVGCKLPLTSGKGFFNLLSLGIGYGSSKYFGALTTVGEDFFRPKFKISALVKPTSSLTLGCNAFTAEKPTDIEKANLVAKFVVTPECTAKAKVNKKGELDAAMSYQALPKVMMVGSVTVAPGTTSLKAFGAGLTLG